MGGDMLIYGSVRACTYNGYICCRSHLQNRHHPVTSRASTDVGLLIHLRSPWYNTPNRLVVVLVHFRLLSCSCTISSLRNLSQGVSHLSPNQHQSARPSILRRNMGQHTFIRVSIGFFEFATRSSSNLRRPSISTLPRILR